MLKKLLCLLLSIIMLNNICVTAFAKENIETLETQYQENSFYIDFTNININKDENGWDITAKNNLAKSTQTIVESNINKLETLIKEFPDIEENLFNDISVNNKLFGVSFTEVPLIEVEGHYERIPNNINTKGYEISEQNGKGKFLLYTSIRGGTSQEENGYLYTATTHGSWSVNNILGGSDYPAAGNDYVFQTSPNEFSRKSDSFSATYDNNPTKGVSGDDYWREDGDSSYIKYVIVDDPLGYRQNKSFTLKTESIGPRTSDTRHINSYYIHTWKEMSLEVSIDANTAKEISLSIKPSISTQSWQVYNYIPFYF